jgi:hypothetical protein
VKLRRYGNRKLYDDVAHRFVSLEDENGSGIDCTPRVLAQVLLHETEVGRPRSVKSILAVLRESPVAELPSKPSPRSIRELLREDTESLLRKPRSP